VSDLLASSAGEHLAGGFHNVCNKAQYAETLTFELHLHRPAPCKLRRQVQSRLKPMLWLPGYMAPHQELFMVAWLGPSRPV
jgi:hypothetical protein